MILLEMTTFLVIKQILLFLLWNALPPVDLPVEKTKKILLNYNYHLKTRRIMG
jgi:hypothetical protein